MNKTCSDYCGAEVGRLHKLGCCMEECPFCHEQLICCLCCYEHLDLDPEQEPICSKGLNEEQERKWDDVLRRKGRIPRGNEKALPTE